MEVFFLLQIDCCILISFCRVQFHWINLFGYIYTQEFYIFFERFFLLHFSVFEIRVNNLVRWIFIYHLLNPSLCCFLLPLVRCRRRLLSRAPHRRLPPSASPRPAISSRRTTAGLHHRRRAHRRSCYPPPPPIVPP